MGLRCLMYENLLVPDYCIKRGIPFKEVEGRFNRMRKNKKLDNLSDEYLIDYIFRTFYPDKPKTNLPYKCKYYVGDIPVSEYANQNNILVYSIRSAVRRSLRENSGADVTKIAIEYVKKNKNKYIFSYGDMPLTDACKKNNISRASVLNVFYDEYPNHDKMTNEEKDAAIKEIVDNILEAKKTKSRVLKHEI